MPRQEVLSIIPARGGSKGLPRKNILDLGGKPLIAWTIEAARACPAITRVVVSTDDPEIADAARAYGAEVPFLRPSELATDTSMLDDVFSHTLDALKAESYEPGAIVAMYPTSPFRSRHMVETLVAKVLNGYRSAITVRPIPANGIGFLRLDGSGRIVSDFPVNRPKGAASTYYRSYGLMHAHNLTDKFAAHGVYLYKVTDPVQLVDIDTIGDMGIARAVLDTGQFKGLLS